MVVTARKRLTPIGTACVPIAVTHAQSRPVHSPARQLQNDLGNALNAQRWSARRMIVVAVLGSLALWTGLIFSAVALIRAFS